MTVTEAVTHRRSIRKFKGEAVPRETVERILDRARWAPSWGNTQPWEFFVLAGPPLESFRAANRQRLSRGVPFSPEVPMPEAWPDRLKGRYGELGKIVLGALGIERGDKASRDGFYLTMAELFGAPLLLVCCLPRALRVEYALFDMGLIVQTICLLAYEEGIGSCVMAAAVGYPDLLREAAGIPDDRRIVMGVALGYPDTEAGVNNFPRPRAPLAELVTWVGGG
ncbi:MAG TPA: nitroreductase [Syntrophales bacterium]|nr:nitroreductase [Syntrophales bacterium]